MNVIDYLIVEHRVMLEWLDGLEDFLSKNTELRPDAIQVQMKCFLRVLEKHSAIEDRFLFPELNKLFDEAQLKPIRIFEFEHQEIEKITQSLQWAQDGRFVRVQTMKLISFLRDHFAKEENVLFPLMMQKVGSNRLEAILKESCLLDRVSCV